jgi:hypothetical protein
MLFVGMGLAWVAYATAYYGVMVLKGTSGPGVTGGLSLKQVLSPVGYYTGAVSPFKPGAGTAASTSPSQNAPNSTSPAPGPNVPGSVPGTGTGNSSSNPNMG